MPQDIILRNLTSPPTPATSSPVVSTKVGERDGSRGGGGSGGGTGGGGYPSPNLGLYDLNNLQYLGAFRATASGPGTTAVKMGFNPPNGGNGTYGSIFQSAAGGKIGEFQIPETLDPTETDFQSLPLAQVLQEYVYPGDIAGGIFDAHPNKTDRWFTTCMMQVVNGNLFIGYMGNYANGAAESMTHQFFMVNNPSDILNSTVTEWVDTGWQNLDDNLMYASPIPSEYQAVLGGEWITGSSSGFQSRDWRYSKGVSLYVTKLEDFTIGDGAVTSTKYMGFVDGYIHRPYWPFTERSDPTWSGTSEEPGWQQERLLHHYTAQLGLNITTADKNDPQEWKDYCAAPVRTEFTELIQNTDSSIVNDLFTNNAHAAIGFIVPGTRTFLCIGKFGGIKYGGYYKAVQLSGSSLSGSGPVDPGDQKQYYWAFDMDDILNAPAPDEVMPYDWGEFDNSRWITHKITSNPLWPLASGVIEGGAFDPATGRVYLMHKRIMKTGTSYISHVCSVYQVV